MGLVVLYLLKINWTSFPLDLVELKLQCLIKELKHIQCISNSIICLLYDKFDQPSGKRIYPNRYAHSTLLQSSRTQLILQHPNSPSSAKPWKISILTKHKVLLKTITALFYQAWILSHMHPSHLLQGQLNKTSVTSHPSWTTAVTPEWKLTRSLSDICFSWIQHLFAN
jgi:hypothetical protein